MGIHYPPVILPASASTCLPICLPICLPLCLPASLSACLSVYLPLYLPASLSACRPICLDRCTNLPAPTNHPMTRASGAICPPARLPVRLFEYSLTCPGLLVFCLITFWSPIARAFVRSESRHLVFDITGQTYVSHLI